MSDFELETVSKISALAREICDKREQEYFNRPDLTIDEIDDCGKCKGCPLYLGDDSFYCLCQATAKAEQREKDKREREEIDRLCKAEAEAKERERMRRWMLETD